MTKKTLPKILTKNLLPKTPPVLGFTSRGEKLGRQDWQGELGMNPKRLGKLDNHDQEPWKMPLKEYIAHLYFKRFGRDRPENVRSIEQLTADRKKKKEAQKERKQERQNPDPKPTEPELPEDPF